MGGRAVLLSGHKAQVLSKRAKTLWHLLCQKILQSHSKRLQCSGDGDWESDKWGSFTQISTQQRQTLLSKSKKLHNTLYFILVHSSAGFRCHVKQGHALIYSSTHTYATLTGSSYLLSCPLSLFLSCWILSSRCCFSSSCSWRCCSIFLWCSRSSCWCLSASKSCWCWGGKSQDFGVERMRQRTQEQGINNRVKSNYNVQEPRLTWRKLHPDSLKSLFWLQSIHAHFLKFYQMTFFCWHSYKGLISRRDFAKHTQSLTLICSCSWTSCCRDSCSCCLWNSAISSCLWSCCLCLRATSSCCSCCSWWPVGHFQDALIRTL